MAQQVSIEAALAAFRRKVGELVDANVLLEARLAEAEQQLEQLRQLGDRQEPDPMPGPAGDQG